MIGKFENVSKKAINSKTKCDYTPRSLIGGAQQITVQTNVLLFHSWRTAIHFREYRRFPTGAKKDRKPKIIYLHMYLQLLTQFDFGLLIFITTSDCFHPISRCQCGKEFFLINQIPAANKAGGEGNLPASVHPAGV